MEMSHHGIAIYSSILNALYMKKKTNSPTLFNNKMASNQSYWLWAPFVYVGSTARSLGEKSRSHKQSSNGTLECPLSHALVWEKEKKGTRGPKRIPLFTTIWCQQGRVKLPPNYIRHQQRIENYTKHEQRIRLRACTGTIPLVGNNGRIKIQFEYINH